jgi:hypothetical protein
VADLDFGLLQPCCGFRFSSLLLQCSVKMASSVVTAGCHEKGCSNPEKAWPCIYMGFTLRA